MTLLWTVFINSIFYVLLYKLIQGRNVVSLTHTHANKLLFCPMVVMSAVHQRAGGVSLHRLPHLTGPECTAGVPNTSGAAE